MGVLKNKSLKNFVEYDYCDKREVMLEKLVQEHFEKCKRYTMVVGRFYQEEIVTGKVDFTELPSNMIIPSFLMPRIYRVLKALIAFYRTVELKDSEMSKTGEMTKRAETTKSAETIKSGETIKNGESETSDVCPICYDDLVNNSNKISSEVVSIKGCGHKFHRGCANRSLMESGLTCPMCRFDVVYSTPKVGGCLKWRLEKEYL